MNGRVRMKALAAIAVLVGAVGVSASGVAGVGRTSTCAIVLPKTSSPTGSRLWTVDHRGVFVATSHFVNADGSIWLKAPWWAAGPRQAPKRGPRGVLRVTGRRLDADAPPLRAGTRQVWQEGFSGSGVWAVVLTFPTEGCWTVTGRVNRTSHTFRLSVTKAEN